MGDEVQDTLLREVFQYHVDLLLRKSRLSGDEQLIDVFIIAEKSTIVAQQRRDDFVLVLAEVVEAVQLVSA